MKNISSICKEISDSLANLPYDTGDLSDIGNEIGIAIGKYLSQDVGFDLDSFNAGIRHGIDLAKRKKLQ
jgi:hypothetical protein